MLLLLWFQVGDPTLLGRTISDGKKRGRKRSKVKDDLTEDDVKVIQLIRAKRKREKLKPIIFEPIPEPEIIPELLPQPFRLEYPFDHEANAQDAALIASVNEQIAKIVQAAADEHRRMQDEDDAEAMLLLT